MLYYRGKLIFHKRPTNYLGRKSETWYMNANDKLNDSTETTPAWQVRAEGLLKEGYKPNAGQVPQFVAYDGGWYAHYVYTHRTTDVSVTVAIPESDWTPSAILEFAKLYRDNAPRGEHRQATRVRKPGKTAKEAPKKHAAQIAAATSRSHAPKVKLSAEQRAEARKAEKDRAKAEKAKAAAKGKKK